MDRRADARHYRRWVKASAIRRLGSDIGEHVVQVLALPRSNQPAVDIAGRSAGRHQFLRQTGAPRAMTVLAGGCIRKRRPAENSGFCASHVKIVAVFPAKRRCDLDAPVK